MFGVFWPIRLTFVVAVLGATFLTGLTWGESNKGCGPRAVYGPPAPIQPLYRSPQ
jgi:hypothetical protein